MTVRRLSGLLVQAIMNNLRRIFDDPATLGLSLAFFQNIVDILIQLSRATTLVG
jgi:hypothetical protein